MLAWNGYGAWGAFVLVVALAAAGFILLQAPRRAQNRFLALALSLDAMGMGLGLGILYLVTDRWVAYNVQVYAVGALLAIPPAYLLFFSTLDTPPSRLLRPGPVRAALLALVVGAFAWVLLAPRFFVADLVRPTYAPWDAAPGPGFSLALASVGVMAFVGIGFSVWFYARHRGAQARAYLLAFGARDALLAITIFTGGVMERNRLPGGAPLNALLAPLTVLLTVALLAYGILRTHLFDIDVRIRWTVSRATLAGAFLAVFFVVAQVAQGFLTTTLGWIMGGVTAGLLLFALAPLQRLAERVATAAVPSGSGDAAYLAFRKLEVYKAALESAHEAGLDARQEALLARLRAKLGISEEAARALADDVASQRLSAEGAVAAS